MASEAVLEMPLRPGIGEGPGSREESTGLAYVPRFVLVAWSARKRARTFRPCSGALADWPARTSVAGQRDGALTVREEAYWLHL